MKLPFLLENLKSNYCKVVFLGSFILSYIFTPKSAFEGKNSLLTIVFIILLSFTVACVTRNIKEKIKQSIKLKHSILSAIASGLGLATLQMCGFSGPSCGASAGAGILSILFPGIAMKIYQGYGTYILIFSIFLQIVGLYFLKCLNIKNKSEQNIKN